MAQSQRGRPRNLTTMLRGVAASPGLRSVDQQNLLLMAEEMEQRNLFTVNDVIKVLEAVEDTVC